MADNTKTPAQETQATDIASPAAEDTSQQAAQQAQTETDSQAAQGMDQAGPDAAQEPVQEADQGGAAEESEAQETQETGKADQAEKTPDIEALQARVLDAELRAAAAVAGVPANRLAYVARLADTGQAKGADPAEYAKDQIKRILSDFPELVQQPSGTGSAGNHARAQEQKKDPFIKGMEA